MRVRTLTIVVAGLLLAADLPKEEAVKQERQKLQGSWKVVAVENSGTKAPDKDIRNWELRVKDDQVTGRNGDEVLEETTCTLDPGQDPKAIDLNYSKGRELGKTVHGIYLLDGDALKICTAAPGKDRPTAFASKPGSDITLVTLQRKK